MPVSTMGFSADRIAELSEDLFELQESFVSKPRKEGAWSRKQILGHLIDSASVNHQRFIEAQVNDSIVFDCYAHREWVELQGYQEQDWEELVTLWSALNMHLCTIVERIPEEILRKQHTAHRFDQMAYRPVPKDQPSTLGYIIEDYFAHLQYHLDQILPE
ncbi:MAG: metal-dependent hydrolase [Phycisphaerae bacterium]|mgnify:CR=1 FL=1|nr:metal-dependent hydrolase [Phycisphaerae bacterium]MBM91225.1 metal-dependent hydrolase [Phycisphaerae bacterium]HCT44760.1 metal-dependent hydrolase [Phycisphaerales bacterium]